MVSFLLKSESEVAYYVSMDEAVLWHKRYEHCNLQTLKHMADTQMVVSMPHMNLRKGACSICEEGKSHRPPFPNQQIRRASQKLELIYTYICGPMYTRLLNGSKYFILFIEDFHRYTWVYFMKMKSKAFQLFMNFKIFAENKVDLKIKTLRSDNGIGFLSNQFQDFLQKIGILHQPSGPYSPQQNGVCEGIIEEY